VREIASGLQRFVPLEQMKGKVVVMANLKPKPLAGFVSNGMVICASNADLSVIELIVPEGEPGERVFLAGFQNLFTQTEIQPVLNQKKKVLERCLKEFKTDEEGFVVWKGIKLMTRVGPLKAKTIKNGFVS